MIPAPYENFLVASTQASAALIGLLFVAVSIAPERIFGGQAEAERHAQARSAFTALANVFFISFTSLIPHLAMGAVVMVVGAVALSQTLSLLFLLPTWRREQTVLRGVLLLGVSAVVYGFEIDFGLQLVFKPADPGALTALLEVLLGAYAIGLRRAWELLGAPLRSGALSTTLGELLARWRRRPAPKKAPDRDDTAGRRS